MAHRIYEAIVKAVKTGRFTKPFPNDDFRTACPVFRMGTYNAFLDKHARGNGYGNPKVFERVLPDRFR